MMKNFLYFGLLVGLMTSHAQAMPPSPLDHFNAGTVPQDRRCAITVSNPEVDFGTQSRWQLEESGAGAISPGQRTLTLSISCPYSQLMSVFLTGDAAPDGNLRYGQKGTLRLEMQDAQLDGQPVQLVPVNREQHRQGGEQNHLMLKAGSGVIASRNGNLIKGKTFTARLEARPLIPESEARVSAHQQSETRMTFELIP